MKPLVTAVIPTYNRQDLLSKAVVSVLRQTYSNIETIIVDNGSLPEGTYDDIIGLGSNIRYFKILEHGANYARNRGILEAHGEYIAFLDDDDEWLPTKIEESLKIFEHDDQIGLVFTDKHIIYENEKISFYSHIPFNADDAAKEILIENFIGTTSCVMVKKTLLQDNMFDVSLPACQDLDLWIRLCRLCKVGHINKPLLNYYLRSSAEQISSDYKKYITAHSIIDKKYAGYFSQLTDRQRALMEKNRFDGLLMKALKFRDWNGYRDLLTRMSICNRFLGLLLWLVGYKNLLRLKSIVARA